MNKKIRDQAATLAKLSCLSAYQIYNELNDYQILSLLSAHFEDSHFVFKQVRRYQRAHGSLVALVQAGSNDKAEEDILKAVKKALYSWLPRSGQVCGVKSSHSWRNPTEGAESDDRFDEEDIRQMQMQRLGGVRKEDGTVDLLSIEHLPAGDYNYRISDFPRK